MGITSRRHLYLCPRRSWPLRAMAQALSAMVV